MPAFETAGIPQPAVNIVVFIQQSPPASFHSFAITIMFPDQVS
jgi:hypothetical protein